MIRIFGSLSLALLIALYFGASDLKYETKEAREELRDVSHEIDREKEAISVLSAEWSYLTRPSNLRKLAEAHLGLDTVRAEQIAAIEDVPWLGFNLFDKDPSGVPVRYKPEPPLNPNLTLPAASAIATAGPSLVRIAHVELGADERWGY